MQQHADDIDWKLTDHRYRRYRFDDSIRKEIDRLRPDNFHALLALAQDYAIIAASIAACYLFWWVYPVAVLVIGARQRGLSTILHDSAHGVCAANRRLNKFLGTWPTAYPIFQRHYAYRLSHVQTHHPYLGNPVKDPDLSFFIREGVYTTARDWKYFGRMIVLPFIGSRTLAYLRYLYINRFQHLTSANRSAAPRNQRPEVRRDNISFTLFWSTVVALCLVTGTWLDLILFWIVPYLTSFHILGWFIELSEHTPHIADHEIDLYMSRNRKSRGVEKFLTGIHNDNHHLDHHLDTRTPFWLLPKAREARMRDRNYAAIDADTGGLFTKGPNGAPSAVSRILAARRESSQLVSCAPGAAHR